MCIALQEVSCLKAELRVLENRLKSCEPEKKGASIKDRERCVLSAVEVCAECSRGVCSVQ